MTRVLGRLLLPLLLVLLPCAPASAGGQPDLSWPLPGAPVVDRPFDPPTSAYGAGHRGVDLRASLGEPVLAADAGRVGYAGLLAGRGVVTVTHAGGLRTTYEPVAATVRVGELVGRGQVLGRLTGGHASCRPGTACLHWGLLRGDTYLDPLARTGSGPVQLLPVDGTAPDPAGAPGPGAGPGTARALDGAAAAGAAGARAAGDREQPPASLAPARHRPGWRRASRAVGALAAGGALVLGISLLRPVPAPPSGSAPAAVLPLDPPAEDRPPPPVDLLGERRRRRSG